MILIAVEQEVEEKDEEYVKKEIEIEENLEDQGIFTDQVGGSQKLPNLEHKNSYGYPYFLNRIVNRLNQGFSPIIVITGKERIGKSELAQLILHYLHNEVNALRGDINRSTIQKHLTYTVEEFMDIIIDEYRKGIIVDEAGSLLKSTKHNSKYNEVADEVIQTMGYKNNLYIFITPQFTRLDKKVRTKADIVLEVIGRGKAKATGINTNYGKIRTNEKELRKIPLPPFAPDRPPKNIREGYDQKEKKFKQGNLEDKRDELREDSEQNLDVEDLL